MYYSDDPVRDFLRHSAEQERELERRPVCEECGEHIQDDYFFLINDEPVCARCLIKNYRKSVDDYIE